MASKTSRKDPQGLTREELDVIYADRVLIREDRSARARIAQYVAYRAAGVKTNKEIAEKLGITAHTLNTLICRASKEGWLKFDAPQEKFEHEIVPKVVENIAYYIDKKDKTMTIEAAKGAGIFRTHQVVRSESESPQTILAIKIEMPEEPAGKAITGNVIGRPRVIEGEVEEK